MGLRLTSVPITRLITGLLAGAATTLCVSAASAQDDDWELIRDPAKSTTMAIAQYDSNLAVAVRCLGTSLDVLIQGLPASTGETRTIEHEILGLGSEPGSWSLSANGQVAFSTAPVRHARTLMGGGSLKLTVVNDDTQETSRFQVELPSESKGIEAVLTACQKPLSDPRFPLRSDLFLSHSTLGWEWQFRVSPQYPSPTQSTEGQARLLCQIRANGRLHNCEIESEAPPGNGFGKAVMDAVPHGLLKATDPSQPIEAGRFISFMTRFRLD